MIFYVMGKIGTPIDAIIYELDREYRDYLLGTNSSIVTGTYKGFLDAQKKCAGEDKVIPILLECDAYERLHAIISNEQSKNNPNYRGAIAQFLEDEKGWDNHIKEIYEITKVEKIFNCDGSFLSVLAELRRYIDFYFGIERR